MADREAVLDALMDGLSIKAAADRFGLRESEVRNILKQETDRCYDGAELRAEWTLTARRLRRMELAKAVEDEGTTSTQKMLAAIRALRNEASAWSDVHAWAPGQVVKLF